MVSVLANSYDRYAKLLNGTHKSHVHSPEEVLILHTNVFVYGFLISLGFLILLIPLQADALSRYKPVINSTSLIHDLQETENSAAKALEYFNTTRHIVVFYEDLITNQTVSFQKHQS